jgi:hypothetical protein
VGDVHAGEGVLTGLDGRCWGLPGEASI